jgi:hypothetical protein
MSLTDFANVVISTSGPALSQVGFGTLLCAGYHTHWGAQERSRTYTDLSGLVTDGFASNDPIYKMVQRAFQQSPRPTQVKVGKCSLPFTQIVKFGVVAAANNTIYGFTAKRVIAGVTTSADIVYTSDGTATVAEIVAGLAAAVEASTLAAPLAAVTADTNTTCQITDTVPGTITYYSNWTPNLTFSDVTTDPGIATDLAAIRAYDSDWYGCAVDLNTKTIVQAASAYIETLDAMFGANCSDSAAFDSASTTDIGYILKGLTTARTILGFDLNDTEGYMGVAMLAERFPHDPGQDGAGGTFHGKSLAGVSADALTPTQKTNLRAKNYVVYITTASRNHTLDGKVAGGEFADKIRGLDWFRIRCEERIATAILNNDKIPYTDRGITVLLGEVLAQGRTAELVELFTPGSFVASAPANASVSTADRNARKLTGIKFSAQLAGAIHLVDPVSGVVT